MQKKTKVFAVIPARNEEKHIAEVVRLARKHVNKIIVIDDASSDRTGELAAKEGAIVLRHIVNLGLGGSLKTGCDAAILLGADVIVTLDGDGQHDPREIPSLVSALREKGADAVFGERPFNQNMPLTKKIGNYFFHLYSRFLFGIKVRDTQTGFRAFTSGAYRKIRWRSSDYAVASEMLINAERQKIKYISQEVSTIYHDDYKGTTIIDGIRIANRMLGIKIR